MAQRWREYVAGQVTDIGTWYGGDVRLFLVREEIYDSPSLTAVKAHYKAMIMRAQRLMRHATQARQKPWHVCPSADPRCRIICGACQIGAYFSISPKWLHLTCSVPVGDVRRVVAVDEVQERLHKDHKEATLKYDLLMHVAACLR